MDCSFHIKQQRGESAPNYIEMTKDFILRHNKMDFLLTGKNT